MIRRHLHKLTLRASFLLLVTAILITGFVFINRLLSYSDSYSQLIFSEEGELLNASPASDEQWRFSPSVTVPDKLKKAIVTFEDKRFYYHPGIDPLAVGRAVWQNLSQMRKVSGASTLTMQLVRLGRSEAPRNIPEKLLEMLIALRLEITYSKQDIIRLWAARAPFGSNVVGFEAASWRFFGRSPDDLSWGEAAMLAVLPNSPGLIYPGRNHDQLLAKRNRLLTRLHDRKIIDSLTCSLAKVEPLPERFFSMPKKLPHLAQHIDKFSGKKTGNRYTVSIKPELQRRLKLLAENYQRQYSRQMIRNIAVIVAETRSGRILGYVGNAGDTTTPGVYVDVLQSLRSTGSLLKPFLYAGALSDGIIAPHELIADLPVNYAGYSPKNYSNQYFGAVKASGALSRSLNVPMVRLLSKFGVDKFSRRLKETGMHSLNEASSHYGLSLILGGADATLYNLTGMYAGMGRALMAYPRLSARYNFYNYHDLHLGQDAQKTKVYDQPPYTAGALWFTLKAMRELKRPAGEGRWQQYTSSRRIAWKTGTSYGFRDAWAIGLDPKFTVGVWVGNADGEPRSGLVGVRKAGPVLFDVFRLLPNCENWFPKPWDDLQKIEICVLSGKPAGIHCTKTHKVYLPAKTASSGACKWCRPVLVNADHSARFYRQCTSAGANLVDTSWFVLPAGMEYFYKQVNSNYQPLPPLASACQTSPNESNPIAFVYPHAGSRFVLPFDVSGRQNEMVFKVVHRFAGSTLFWYLDDRFITQTRNYHEIGLQPSTGEHTLLVEDEKGNRKQISFKILKKSAAIRSTAK